MRKLAIVAMSTQLALLAFAAMPVATYAADTASSSSTKSIRHWVSCDESIDESAQVEAALQAAANHAFTLVVDCPVRLHTGSAASRSIAVPDGVTIEFEGAGEFLAVSNGPPALTVANPDEVTFINWNYTYL